MSVTENAAAWILLVEEGNSVALTDGPPSDDDDVADSDEWLAAEVRQLFRARLAGDAKAVRVALFYFDNYLTKIIRRQLRDRDPAWCERQWSFDGLYAEAEFPGPGLLRFRGEACWMEQPMEFYFDPVDFEMELCPRTGEFQRYVFRFGDHRPLSAKVRGHSDPLDPVGGWKFVVERCRAEPLSRPDRLSENETP